MKDLELNCVVHFCAAGEIAMVNKTHHNQRGASTLGTVILLGVVGYAVFIGLQYIPQKIEDMAVDSVLGGVEDIRQQNPSGSVHDVEASIDKLLSTNSREHLRSNFKVYRGGNGIEVTFSREWTLNLIYTEQAMKHEKTLVLR
jgi:hypothetical protein